MTIVQYLLILAGALVVVLLATIAPQPFLRIGGRLLGNTVAGVALLLLVNAVSRSTGLIMPLNWCTLAVGAALGAPGMAALTLLAAI